MKPEFYYQQVASIMRDNQFDRSIPGFRSGKLSNNKLYKVQTKNDRVFERRVERKNKKYNVVLMIDESGSMSWGYCDNDGIQSSRISVAAECLCMISEALSKCNIDFCIMGFGRRILLYKDFSEKLTHKEYLRLPSKMYHDTASYGGCTHSLLASIQIEETIKHLNPNNTIVMEFIDGCPGCTCSDHAQDRNKLKAIDKRIKEKSKLITFGIGVQENEYERENSINNYYPDIVPINSKTEFMSRSLYAIKAVIQRG